MNAIKLNLISTQLVHLIFLTLNIGFDLLVLVVETLGNVGFFVYPVKHLVVPDR